MGSSASKNEDLPTHSSAKVEEQSSAGTSTSSNCPVAPLNSSPVYNVYNQRIDAGACPSVASSPMLDPRNNMPLQPNQQPWPGQSRLLSTERLQSTIPKGGTESTWIYPSPQMFFNALKRKHKADDVTEGDMDSVVFAHNTMNEVTWARVQQWESLHRSDCQNPRLRRFLGRPDELSPLARIQYWMGGDLPFDRHDWYVDRCGEEVRYVIDFYFHEDHAGTPEAFTIRARPALDNFDALLDRTKMKIYKTCAKYGLPCPITGHPSGLGSQKEQGSREEAYSSSSGQSQAATS